MYLWKSRSSLQIDSHGGTVLWSLAFCLFLKQALFSFYFEPQQSLLGSPGSWWQMCSMALLCTFTSCIENFSSGRKDTIPPTAWTTRAWLLENRIQQSSMPCQCNPSWHPLYFKFSGTGQHSNRKRENEFRSLSRGTPNFTTLLACTPLIN